MEHNIDPSTPKNKCRSLGLKRSIRKTTVSKTPATISRTENIFPRETAELIDSPSTPAVTQQKLPIEQRSAYTTNCLRYRLALGHHKQRVYKKKKLEFNSCLQSPESIPRNKPTSPTDKPIEVPSTDLLAEVINAEMLLKSQEKHEAKVQELKSAIDIWKEAFKASLEELSSKIEPKMELEDLLDRLNIPPEMIDYT